MREIHQLLGLLCPWFWRVRRPLRLRMAELLLLWLVAVLALMMTMFMVPPRLMLVRSPSKFVGRDDSG